MKISKKILKSFSGAISVIVLFSYLFLVAVTSFHYHTLELSGTKNTTLNEYSKTLKSNLHDPSKCTIYHFSGFKTVKKQVNFLDDKLDLIAFQLSANQNYFNAKTYLTKKLRGPPVHNS